MKHAGRILSSVVGVFVLWLAITMAVSPALIVPVPKHGETPERVSFERTPATEISRYVAAGLMGFFGLTLAVAPWRRRSAAVSEGETSDRAGAPRQG